MIPSAWALSRPSREVPAMEENQRLDRWRFVESGKSWWLWRWKKWKWDECRGGRDCMFGENRQGIRHCSDLSSSSLRFAVVLLSAALLCDVLTKHSASALIVDLLTFQTGRTITKENETAKSFYFTSRQPRLNRWADNVQEEFYLRDVCKEKIISGSLWKKRKQITQKNKKKGRSQAIECWQSNSTQCCSGENVRTCKSQVACTSSKVERRNSVAYP